MIYMRLHIYIYMYIRTCTNMDICIVCIPLVFSHDTYLSIYPSVYTALCSCRVPVRKCCQKLPEVAALI